MLADVSWEPRELSGQLYQITPGRRLQTRRVLRDTRQLQTEVSGLTRLAELGDAVEIGDGDAKRLPDITERGAETVGGKGADERGMVGGRQAVQERAEARGWFRRMWRDIGGPRPPRPPR